MIILVFVMNMASYGASGFQKLWAVGTLELQSVDVAGFNVFYQVTFSLDNFVARYTLPEEHSIFVCDLFDKPF